MITVVVDSQQFNADIGNLKTMGDLLELIKANIDPDSIITSLTLQGQPLSDRDWQVPLTGHHGALLEVTTGDKERYVAERLGQAEGYLDQIHLEFSQAGEAYRLGDAMKGNQFLATAVDDLLAFLNWYVSLLSLERDKRNAQLEQFQQRLEAVKDTCEQLVQQQLYNSWTMLGQTVETRLLPLLTDLKSFCRQYA